ncbi:hypothetical protein OUZ56_010284 [Daphnia magna]|uniref:Uncharacterized protein n=1 Tax=Daphnia magna TaxID=35525 RepID=A0ABR0AIB7_9CRUS|nr:hypothetical protein OUZ56_010284 [Daphnia magna]
MTQPGFFTLKMLTHLGSLSNMTRVQVDPVLPYIIKRPRNFGSSRDYFRPKFSCRLDGGFDGCVICFEVLLVCAAGWDLAPIAS